ncbi:MAG: hypothetical protein OXP71_03970 [Candidatus Poribacteria bacterium]|nr:hypothetical protein [Candidatus Poribacteria bacterium]
MKCVFAVLLAVLCAGVCDLAALQADYPPSDGNQARNPVVVIQLPSIVDDNPCDPLPDTVMPPIIIGCDAPPELELPAHSVTIARVFWFTVRALLALVYIHP